MSSLSIRSFTLFREEQPVRDALVLFTLTLLLHFLGAMLRLVQELSFFWPLNAVMAGIFARYVWLNRSYFYAVCFAAMLVYDGLTSRWGMGFASLLINFSNIVFIVTLAQLVLWDKRRADSMPGPINALNLFCFCLLAALLCAAVGALGSVDVERATFVPQLADWFSEQFSTAVLILPFILTLTLPSALSGFRFRQLLPVLAVAHFAPRGSAILLEEPEIHLHPQAQAVLAELFVEVSRERGVQFIVETHSEHLFRRLQTLLAAEKAEPQDCAMYFVERESGAAHMRALHLDRFGRVGNWPEGFFGDALGETREQARLMFERRRREVG